MVIARPVVCTHEDDVNIARGSAMLECIIENRYIRTAMGCYLDSRNPVDGFHYRNRRIQHLVDETLVASIPSKHDCR
jgi:hypothetical protein